jgi:hypothetical protein
MNKFGQFLQEANGQYSATRLSFLAWVFGVLIVWSSGSFYNKKMLEVPSSVEIIIGILMTGKVAQKFKEETSTTTSLDVPNIENGIKSNIELPVNGVATTSGKQN